MPHTNPPAIGPPHWKHLLVLAVDDHCAYRSLMSTCLETLGVGYRVFADGHAALQALLPGQADLVLTDCRMPVMDGYHMSREIRRRECEQGLPRIPIVALTASLSPEEIKLCFDAGMDACLIKPVRLARLREVLESWLPDADGQRTKPGRWVADSRADWPTRRSLIETFGSQEVVERMLDSLVREAHDDYHVLLQGMIRLDTQMIVERLHRLVGSLAFLGAVELEQRCLALMAEVHAQGLVANKALLEQILEDVCTYLDYLTEIVNLPLQKDHCGKSLPALLVFCVGNFSLFCGI